MKKESDNVIKSRFRPNKVKPLTAEEKNIIKTEKNIAYYASHPEKIDSRLKELDSEWDIERTLEANASGLALASLAMGTLTNRKWLFVTAMVGGFLFQNAIRGCCPPLTLLRKLGYRTQIEIERERYALKALRGDFSRIKMDEAPGKNNVVFLSKKIIDAVTGKSDN